MKSRNWEFCKTWNRSVWFLTNSNNTESRRQIEASVSSTIQNILATVFTKNIGVSPYLPIENIFYLFVDFVSIAPNFADRMRISLNDTIFNIYLDLINQYVKLCVSAVRRSTLSLWEEKEKPVLSRNFRQLKNFLVTLFSMQLGAMFDTNISLFDRNSRIETLWKTRGVSSMVERSPGWRKKRCKMSEWSRSNYKLLSRTEQPRRKMRAHPRATDKRNACTHTRVRPVFHVFTLGRVAAGVTCTRLHTDVHRTGTVAPVGHTNVHACVTSLCLFVFYTSTRT